jgi:hypothetical protein
MTVSLAEYCFSGESSALDNKRRPFSMNLLRESQLDHMAPDGATPRRSARTTNIASKPRQRGCFSAGMTELAIAGAVSFCCGAR